MTPSATLTEAQREAYEERAAIMEYDGGLSRKEAERRALDRLHQMDQELFAQKERA